MIMSFLKDNKKYQLHEYIIQYIILLLLNTLFKDLELKQKNSKYYKDKIAPNLINRQN